MLCDTGNSDGGFLSRACFAHPAFLIFDIEFEVVQLLRMGLFGGRCLNLARD